MPRKTYSAGKTEKEAAPVTAFISWLSKEENAETQRKNAATRADWGEVDPTFIGEFVTALNQAGCGVLLGTDSTGFGYTISIYGGEKPVRKWFHPVQGEDDAMLTWMRQLMSAASELRE